MKSLEVTFTLLPSGRLLLKNPDGSFMKDYDTSYAAEYVIRGLYETIPDTDSKGQGLFVPLSVSTQHGAVNKSVRRCLRVRSDPEDGHITKAHCEDDDWAEAGELPLGEFVSSMISECLFRHSEYVYPYPAYGGYGCEITIGTEKPHESQS